MRVAVLIGARPLDLELPTHIEVGLLIPMVWDIAADTIGELDEFHLPLARELQRPGRTALDPTKTLSGNGIRDGDTLVLAARSPVEPSPAVVDAAMAYASPAPVPTGGTRSVALFAAVGLVATAGLTAVPGTPGVETVLLTAAATSAGAAVAARLSSPGSVPLAALAVAGVLTAGAACATLTVGGGLRQCGVVLIAASMALLAGAGRLTVALCDRALPATAAPVALSALMTASAVAATIAVLLALTDDFDWRAVILGTVVSALLVLRTGAGTAARVALISAAALCTIFLLVAVARAAPMPSLWAPAAAIGLAGAFVATRRRLPSPMAQRGAELLERALLVALIPLCCWVFDVYQVFR